MEDSKNYIIEKTNTKSMGISELFAKNIEKVAKDKDRIINKKDDALLKKDKLTEKVARI